MAVRATNKLPPRPASRNEFSVAILCDLPTSADAVSALFDHYWNEEEHSDGSLFDKAPGDTNFYSMGVIGHHNVVLAHKPTMGISSAASAAHACKMSFPNIELAVVVGICGIVPGSDNKERLLGDVVISDAIKQLDFGRGRMEDYERKSKIFDIHARPPFEIRSFLAKFQSLRYRQRLQDKITQYLNILGQNDTLHAQYPGREHDKLFEPEYTHKDRRKSCDELGCNGDLVVRQRLLTDLDSPTQVVVDDPTPDIHIGTIASSDTLIKSGKERDIIANQETVIAFDMAAAGALDFFPGVVIKGACDYADGHGSKMWQQYAAAVAAACLKGFLQMWKPLGTETQGYLPAAVDREYLQICENHLCSPSFNERFDSIRKFDAADWLFHQNEFKEWDIISTGDNKKNTARLLTIKGRPFSGKSVLMKEAVVRKLKETHTITLYHFFVDHGNNSPGSNIPSFLRQLLAQLLRQVQQIPWSDIRRWGKDINEKRDAGLWSRGHLQEAIKRIILVNREALISGGIGIRIFVDSINECSDTQDVNLSLGQEQPKLGPVLVLELLSSLLGFGLSAGIDIAVCISRRNQPLYGPLEPYTKVLELENYTYTEIRKFVWLQLQKLGHADWELRLFNELKKNWPDDFVWATLVTKHILDSTSSSFEMLKGIALEPPSKYKRLLQKTLDTLKVSPQSHSVLMLLLQLGLGSWRPLTGDEFRHALAFSTKFEYGSMLEWERSKEGLPTGTSFENFIERESGGLLRIVPWARSPTNSTVAYTAESEIETCQRVSFIHHSMMSLLRGKTGLCQLYEDSPSTFDQHCHLLLFRICLSVLDFCTIRDVTDEDVELCDYACEFWLRHAQRCGELARSITLPTFMRNCMGKKIKRLIERQLRLMNKSQAKESVLLEGQTSMMVLLSTMGCTILLQEHLKSCNTCQKAITSTPDNEGPLNLGKMFSTHRGSHYQKMSVINEDREGTTAFVAHKRPEMSDSGYASGTHGRSYTIQTFSEGILEVIEPEENASMEPSSEIDTLPDRGLYEKNTAYSPSETPSLAPIRNSTYINDLAEQLYKTVGSRTSDYETLNRISQELPHLLRAFSLKIGFRATPSQCHIAYFLHKYRRDVRQAFENMFQPESVRSIDDEDDIQEAGNFKVERFLENLGLAGAPLQDNIPGYSDPSADNDDKDDAEEFVETLEPDWYKSFVLNSAAFNWLVTTLLTELQLTCQIANNMRGIRRQILGALPSEHTVSRRIPSKEYKAKFEINWDPLSFFRDQKYPESPYDAFQHSLTITGAPEDAQCLTTTQYMCQTWPANGLEVLQLVARTIQSSNQKASGILLDGTELRMRINGTKFEVDATGIGDSLAEVAQQFGWLGAALRSSPFTSGIARCTPTIRNLRLEKGNSNDNNSTSHPDLYTEISCVIDFEIQEPLSVTQRGSGHCWHNMFRNPVMVVGYPILAKHKAGLGLELPLNVLSDMAGSKYASEFDGKVVIKGFSVMLIATEVSRDLLLWHYYFNATGERISYFDHSLGDIAAIGLQRLQQSRHIVGWCYECESYAGAENFLYKNITSVDLPQPHSDCILEKVSISGGKLISGGVTFAVGVHHNTPHLTRNSYLSKLAWISTRFAVFWDVEKSRGWLVNGTSALLHLVRASIEYESTYRFSALMTFDPSKIQSPNTLDPNFAAQVLSNPDNLGVEVGIDKIERIDEGEVEYGQNNPSTWKTKIKRTYKLFCDIVEEKYYYLEQIMDFQAQGGGQNGVRIKLRVRSHLEGWDFKELVTGQDPIPKVVTLNRYGWGWVDFVRSIEAITLVGSGFGEMIRPTEFNGMCPDWKALPVGKHYLAATVFDLKNIIGTAKFGGSLGNPIKAVRGLLWHTPQDMVASCPCHSGSNHHHDPVQVLYPTVVKQIFPIRSPAKLHPAGAVVFGCSTKWRLYWKNQGSDLAQLDGLPSSSEAASTSELDANESRITNSHADSSEVTGQSSNTSAHGAASTSTTIPTSNSSVSVSTTQAPFENTSQGGVREVRQSKYRNNILMKMVQKIRKNREELGK